MITRCFTFGFAHAFPSGYVTVTRDTYQECRDVMVEHFGNKWAFDYTPEQIAEQRKKFPHMYEVPFPPGKGA